MTKVVSPITHANVEGEVKLFRIVATFRVLAVPIKSATPGQRTERTGNVNVMRRFAIGKLL